jgi:hypothetical protein
LISIFYVKKFKKVASRKVERFARVLSHCERLLKAIEEPLGTAKRVQESCWEIPKDYWLAFGQFLKDVGKPLGNAQIICISQWKRRQNCLAATGKNVAISIPFP